MRNPDVAQPVELLERGVREKKSISLRQEVIAASDCSLQPLERQTRPFFLPSITVSMKEEPSQLGFEVPPGRNTRMATSRKRAITKTDKTATMTIFLGIPFSKYLPSQNRRCAKQ